MTERQIRGYISERAYALLQARVELEKMARRNVHQGEVIDAALLAYLEPGEDATFARDAILNELRDLRRVIEERCPAAMTTMAGEVSTEVPPTRQTFEEVDWGLEDDHAPLPSTPGQKGWFRRRGLA